MAFDRKIITGQFAFLNDNQNNCYPVGPFNFQKTHEGTHTLKRRRSTLRNYFEVTTARKL